MWKENIVMLRKLNGFTQEELAEKIGISRQAYAKWESGATVPDLEKAARLAEVYGVTLDAL
ncbi:MAG: helix-turn-helix transcriptional regulator, partial [bacterium]